MKKDKIILINYDPSMINPKSLDVILESLHKVKALPDALLLILPIGFTIDKDVVFLNKEK